MALVLRLSEIHAHGCYTTTAIKKRTFIVEYTGERITKSQGDELYENSRRTYLFGLDDGKHVIDGDGVAAFLNHCCEPNCETDQVKGRVWIIALRDIQAGEELTYDYNLYDGDENDKAVCRCGAKKCRGTMYSEQEIARRQRAAARGKGKAKKNASRRAAVKKPEPKPSLTKEQARLARRRADARRRKTRLTYSSPATD